jgi:2-polyprenyl-3-methyl-5-hydroxy-6-metoxy-1,4-benzoquinol methylase
MQNNQSSKNKNAWSYRDYEHWCTNYGPSNIIGTKLKNDPYQKLEYYMNDLGDVSGKKIANLLGSAGFRAVPLAVLGADVTVVDISEENARYATELAKAAEVKINYINSDVFDIPDDIKHGNFDIVFMEFGVLHYFSDLKKFTKLVYEMIREDGFMLLRDFHPLGKFIQINDDGEISIMGDYFDSNLKENPVAFEGFFPEVERDQFPKTYLRKWTMAEIITSFAGAGFIIKKLIEEPNPVCRSIPMSYMIKAMKREG